MEYFVDNGFNKKYILRLDQGELVLESIQKLIELENIKNGMVVSAIGTLDYCTLHMVTTTGYPPKEHFEIWEDKPLELCSIDGIIADGTPHFHTVVSDSDKAYGGHLENGCRVLYLCEIVIEEFSNVELKRIRNEKNILKLVEKSQQ